MRARVQRNRRHLFIKRYRLSSLFASCAVLAGRTATRSVWSASSLLALSYGGGGFKSGSKLHALQTLRAIRLFFSRAALQWSRLIADSEELPVGIGAAAVF